MNLFQDSLILIVSNMAIVNKVKDSKIHIDLEGSQGNAFVLIGTAMKLAKQCGMDGDQIVKEMTSGDYEHLISVLEKYFGEHIVLYRSF